MTFEYLPPWWAWLLLVTAVAALASWAYLRPAVPLGRPRQAALISLRAATLLLVAIMLLRPVALVPTARWQDAVVPVLIDTSRSMRLRDVDGRPRIERAAGIVRSVLPTLADFQVDLVGFGEALVPVDLAALRADGRRSDLGGALRSLVDRYRGRHVAGIVVVSDGGETGGVDVTTGSEALPPVYAIGVGARRIRRDREVASVTIGEPPLPGSVVTLSATLVSHGYGEAPFDVRVLDNGRVVQVRRVRPVADGVPLPETFHLSPAADAATLYSVELPVDPGELVGENNRRSVLVRPAGPRRRVLLVEGAPGFEHAFLKRALARDPGLEVDAVVRKGQNDRGESTFYVQAPVPRAAALAPGFPREREPLFAYDALILANVEGDFFSRDQLAAAAEFVGTRGGGLLVLGARAFAGRTFLGTPLEDVLPVDLMGRATVAQTAWSARALHKADVTLDGTTHPVTSLGVTPEETRARWGAVPPLAAVAPLGRPKPGASVLAVAASPMGAQPLVVVQRYGRGRAMVFAGEAAWRWRMRLPAGDRTYETFWRQAVRWLAGAAPGPVSTVATGGTMPGDLARIDVDVRDARFEVVHDARVTVRIETPGGGLREERPALVDAAGGRYRVEFRPDQSGVYRIRAEARRGTTLLGTADEWVLVGGADPEFADPRLNDDVLRRLAVATGGRYLADTEAGALSGLLRAHALESRPLERRDLWHTPWTFLALVGLLSAEWICRRRWGMR